MPIKASAARQIETLIADLGSDRADVREAAVARLTLVGARAVDRLLVLLDSSAHLSARVAALRTLEAIADPRAMNRVLDAVDSPDVTEASAAASAARVFLRGAQGAAVVDRLARVAMDASRGESVRIAAVRVLGDLDPATIAPLLEVLRRDPNEAVRAATRPTLEPVEVIARAADFGLPEDPIDLAAALTGAGGDVPLPQVLRVIERVREREAAEPPARRAEWTRLRGRAHIVLADRGSRIALYDLRETIEAAADPLPVEFLAALSTAGDASCLDAIAAAYARARPPAGAAEDDDQGGWWRAHLADAFQLIVGRERLTRGHAQMKKIEKRWGAALDELWAGRAGKSGGSGAGGKGSKTGRHRKT